MTKKRLTFDIDLPEGGPEDEALDPVASRSLRRGPMATAIGENADSLRERRKIEEEIRAENDTLATEHVRLKRLGLTLDLIPLDQIETTKLMRDRAKKDDKELDELVASIRDVGLSNPIRVEERGDGRFELIQGYRRIAAYRALLNATDDVAAWGAIPAAIMQRGQSIEQLYRRMVDENLVRKDISLAEMAQMAIHYANDPGTAEFDPDKAVGKLFQSTSYQKRSYIRGFIRLMQDLSMDLMYYPHIPRALGLKVSSELEERPQLVKNIRLALKDWENRSVYDELEVLRQAVGITAEDDDAILQTPITKPEAPKTITRPKLSGDGSAKITFRIASRSGTAKCAAEDGRLEIRMNRDFSGMDRKKLEQALRALLDQLV